jgi:hypothetical protein
MSLIPKRMFRAHDQEKNRGNLFVFAHKHGPDGKVLWRPDNEDFDPVEEHAPDIEKWEETLPAKLVTRYKEIPVEEGTEKISVTQVSMVAAPLFKPSAGRE